MWFHVHEMPQTGKPADREQTGGYLGLGAGEGLLMGPGVGGGDEKSWN